MDRLTEKYIESVSTKEDPLLNELYRLTNIRFVNPNMVSGHLQGKFLEMITRMVKPRVALEIGTYTGYSAISIARGLPSGSKLITIEENDELAEFSTSFFEKAGVENSVRLINGKAQEVIPTLDEEFDLVFLDGDKREYCEYFMCLREKVAKGGFILADNVLWGGKMTDPDLNDQQTRGIVEFNLMISRTEGFENVILPLRDGLMLIRKC